MTTARKREQAKIRSIWKSALTTGIILLFFTMLILSKEISTYALEGLDLAVKLILPSVFPFLLITDVLITSIRAEKVTLLHRAFERIFRISGEGIATFFCGILCGFPVGAKMSAELYKNGIISKCECERLMSFCNNASPAYVIFVVGLALRENIRDGIFLYFTMIISAVISGFIIGIKKEKQSNSCDINWQKYSFVNSIKHSCEVCINICAFITAFAIICGLIKKFIRNQLVCGAIISLLEIGNASRYLSELCISHPLYSFVLTSFAVSFSGISVISQAAYIIGSQSNISIAKHVKYKLLQGFISAMISLIIYPVLK